MDLLEKKTKDQFDKIYNAKKNIEYSFNPKALSKKDRKIISTLNQFGISGNKCLDIGIGTGRWLQFLKANSPSFLGAIDISQEALRRSDKIYDKSQKANLEHEKFDYPTDYFDIVISIEVMDHFRDPENYLSEIIRVVKDSGLILIALTNFTSFTSRVRMFFGLLPMAMVLDKTHYSFYRKKDIKRILNEYGQKPQFIPTSFSLNPKNHKTFRVPTNQFTSFLDDSLLFQVRVNNNI